MNHGVRRRKGLSVLVLGLLGVLLTVVPGWTAEDAIDAITFDSAPSSGITYTGSWTHGTGWSKAYAGTVSYSNQTGAKATLVFTGRYITRVYTMTTNRGNAKIYIDGVLRNTMSDYATSTRWQVAKTWDTGLYGQHTIEIVNDGGGYIDSDAFIVDIVAGGNSLYDNTHWQLGYIGTWDSPSSGWSAAYDNTLRWTNGSENAVSFTFSGDSVTYLYTKTTNRGKASVTIDGIDKGLLDLYASSPQFQQGTVYNNLGGGTHTIHVAATGQKNGSSGGYYIDVDAFKVGAVYNRTAAVNYADTWAHARNGNYPNYGNPNDNPCNDCTNFVSQVLQAGGIPQIANPSYDNEYYWYTYYIIGWNSSYTWRITTASNLPSLKTHADVFPARYQLTGSSKSHVDSLSAGDFILMDLDTNVFSFDHASVIMGKGYPEEGDRQGEILTLRNAHCSDRKRVRWDYNVPANTQLQAYHVVY